MRTMLRFSFPGERGNQAVKDGTVEKTLGALLEQLKPEAAYFMPDGGERGGFIVFDMTDAAQVATVLEPLWMNLDAAVDLTPVMNADDLKRGLATLKKA